MISVTSCISCDPFLVLSCILDVYLCGLSLKDLKLHLDPMIVAYLCLFVTEQLTTTRDPAVFIMRPHQGTRCDPLKKLCSIYQRGRNIEAYVEEFLSYYHLVPGDDALLRDCFWSGLDLDISLHLPDEDPGWSLAQYIDFVLLFCGSEFTVGEVEEEVSSKHFLPGGSRPWAPVATESGRPGLPPCHTLTIASPVFVTTPMPQPEPIPKMVAMLQSESALSTQDSCHATARANSQDGCHAPVRVSTQHSR